MRQSLRYTQRLLIFATKISLTPTGITVRYTSPSKGPWRSGCQTNRFNSLRGLRLRIFNRNEFRALAQLVAKVRAEIHADDERLGQLVLRARHEAGFTNEFVLGEIAEAQSLVDRDHCCMSPRQDLALRIK